MTKAVPHETLYRLCARLPVAMSLLALAVLLTWLVMGWERGRTDEGVGAHLFQLLVFGQLPLIVLSLALADWSRPKRAALWAGLQACALALPMGLLYAAEHGHRL